MTGIASGIPGSYSVTATVDGTLISTTFSVTNTVGAPASITVVSGSPQNVTVGTSLTNLVAVVKDSFGNLLTGITVDFTDPGSGATATLGPPSSVTTDGSGNATMTGTASGTPGSYSVTATVHGTLIATTFSVTNTVGAPASIAVVSGSPQNVTVGTALTNLVAVVKDSFGNLLPGITVDFTDPASGATATLGPPSSVTTDGSGDATMTGTASGSPGNYSVIATVHGTSLSTTFSITNTVGAPASIAVVSGSPQNVTVGSSLANLVAVVEDSFGNVLSGITVDFSAPASGASATLATLSSVATDGNGDATMTAVANGIPGAYSVTATVDGTLISTAFSVTNTVGAPASITVVSGSPQSVTVGTALTNLVAVVKDAFGNQLTGISVGFTDPAGGATATLATPASVTTDGNGDATMTGTASGTPGAYLVTATVLGTSVSTTFSVTNTVAAPASITVVSGSPQNVTVGTSLTNLVAVVKDSFGNLLTGITVDFTDPASGATATLGPPSSVTTDGSGDATMTGTASGTPGGYSVTATVHNTSLSTTFSITNTVGAPASIAVVSGSPQNVTVGTSLANLVAVVEDSFGNVLSGITVDFTDPVSGATASLATPSVTTDGSGDATMRGTASGTPGAYSVTATVDGTGIATTFSVTNTVGAPASITVVSGSPQNVTVGTALTNLVAVVKDAFGNQLTGISVGFTDPAGGATATLATPASVTTDGNGDATMTGTASGTPGAYLVTATVLGTGISTTFSVTNTVAAPASITLVSGSPQNVTVGTALTNLVAVVKDSFGNVLPGITVDFTDPGTGATATLGPPASVTTDGSGDATMTGTASGTPGSYSVTATVHGTSFSAQFSITNTVGAPASIAVVSGSPQNVTVGTSLANLVAVVEDSFGNVLSGITVDFTDPVSGATASLATPSVTTDGSGDATMTGTASGTPGAYSVTATVDGTGISTTFSITNTVGAPASIAVVSGSPQNVTVGTSLTNLVAVVRICLATC